MRELAGLTLLLISLGACADEWDFGHYVIKFQATTVTQDHERTSAPSYLVPAANTLSTSNEMRTSFTSTFFTGVRVRGNTELYFDPEISAGSGISDTKGIAGYPNGEIYRVDSADPKISVARFFFKQVIGFSSETESFEPDQLQLKATYPVQRLSIYAGRFSLNDFLDNNSYSHDPRTQFLNWSLMDNGAWDYAADNKGYTWALLLEYNQKEFAVRLASGLEPYSANSAQLDYNIGVSRGDNLELEYRYSNSEHPGKLCGLVFINHANMGNYAAATASAGGSAPDITATRTYREKYGYAFNWEQELAANVGIFSRWGWNDGKSESWAFTEVDDSVSAGISVKVGDNNWGFALIQNELSPDHRAYLSAGGLGFMLGEGGLNYAPEQIGEAYYLSQLTESLAMTADLQVINHPGYNQDHGGTVLAAIRFHYEF